MHIMITYVFTSHFPSANQKGYQILLHRSRLTDEHQSEHWKDEEDQ